MPSKKIIVVSGKRKTALARAIVKPGAGVPYRYRRGIYELDLNVFKLHHAYYRSFGGIGIVCYIGQRIGSCCQ